MNNLDEMYSNAINDVKQMFEEDGVSYTSDDVLNNVGSLFLERLEAEGIKYLEDISNG